MRTKQRVIWITARNPAVRFVIEILLVLGLALFARSVYAAGTTETAGAAKTDALSAKPAGDWRLLGAKTPGVKRVTIDFNKAAIQDVLKALAIQSGTNIMVAPKVEGEITVRLRDVPPEQALAYIVRLGSLAYGREGDTYIVCPRDQTATIFPPGAAGQLLFPPPSVSAAPAAPEVALVRAERVAPEEIRAILQKAVPGIEVQNPEPKVIALIGTAAQVQTGQATIKALEDAVNASYPAPPALQNETPQIPPDMDIVTYTLKHVSAVDAGRLLQGFMNSGMLPKVVVTPAPSPAFPTVKSETATTYATTVQQVADPSQALLNLLYRDSIKKPEPRAAQTPEVSEDKSGEELPPGATVAIPTDSSTHTLLLIGPRVDITRVRDSLDRIDVAPAQVMIDVKVTEVSLSDQEQLGVTWDWSTYGIREMTPTGSSSGVVPELQLGRFGHVPVSFNATLEAMLKTEKARLLANPRVAVLDGQTASIHVGDTIRYLEQRTVGVTGTSSVTIGSVNVGVVVDVAPRVGGDSVITLDVRPKVSVITGYTPTGDGGQVPNTSERSVQTVIRLRDGETLAIGGLIREEDVTTMQRVPGLGDLPLVGSLFRFKDKQRRNSEVLIFMTPHVTRETP